MIEVLDSKNDKVVFGYYLKAVRNDTNFIYSKLTQTGDTIYNRTYHRYKITNRTDSTVSRYICSPRGLVFYNHQRFWNGSLVSNELFNKKIN
ncbi:hypothetical protein [Sediminibacterium soli]|uniref:hypothetical protein n=1 Tax=Sediminibacterium soli TaxID=2698829 RepID=UPI00137B3B05|nr:hypothetical protein [Sediminibacterium soli]NCI46362.1 hypothetical protein [Sediminibacterium soli]